MSRWRLVIRDPQSAPPPVFTTAPSIVSEDPGIYRVGVQLQAIPPSYTPPTAVLTFDGWYYGDDTPLGITDEFYTPEELDEWATLKVRFTGEANGQTITEYSAAVGPIEAASPGGVPVVANQTILFGRNTRSGAGIAYPSNSGGPITSASITGGNGDGHWQISATGGLTPTISGGLNASYSLTCQFTNGSGSDTATITINTEADSYSVAAIAEFNTAAALVSAGGSVKLRPNVIFTPFAPSVLNRVFASDVTIESYDADNPGAFDWAGTFSGTARPTAWNNLIFRNVKFTPRFLRRSQGRTSGALPFANSIGKVHFYDCEAAGDMTQLGPPGQHFQGFLNVASGCDTSNMDVLWHGGSVHGLWQAWQMRSGISGGSSGKFQAIGVDVYDIGLDNVQFSDGWDTGYPLVKGCYMHSNYINRSRVQLTNTSGVTTGAVYVRSGNWTGAANSTKCFFLYCGDYVANTASSGPRTLYAHGDGVTNTLRIWRDASGKIGVQVRDTLGNLVVDQQTVGAYGASTASTGTPKLCVAISIDTDRSLQFRVWKEANGGGGSWDTATGSESITVPLTGSETLDLAGGNAYLGGLPNGASAKKECEFTYITTLGLWFGVAPDLDVSDNRTVLVSDASSADGDQAAIFAQIGTPAVFLRGDLELWDQSTLSMNQGTGGQFSGVHPGSGAADATIDHSDALQGLFNATVNGFTVQSNVFTNLFDSSPQYARPWDPTGQYIDYQMQGPFFEDMNSDHYNTNGRIIGNIVIVGAPQGVWIYNGIESLVGGNTVIAVPDWPIGFTSTPAIRSQIHKVAPLSADNVLADNFVRTLSSTIATDTITNNQTFGALADIGSYVNAGATPATYSEVITYCTPIIGSPLLSAVPLKIGAVGTYFDQTTGDADYPRANTATFTIADLTGQSTNTLCTSAATLIDAILNSQGDLAVNGGLVQVSGAGSPQFRITSDIGGSVVIVNWTSSPAVVENGQYLWVRATSSASPSTTTDVEVLIGASADTWSITTA